VKIEVESKDIKLKVGDLVRCWDMFSHPRKERVGIIIEFDDDGDPVMWTDHGIMVEWYDRVKPNVVPLEE